MKKHTSNTSDYSAPDQHAFAKITIWVIMILLSAALLFQPLLPLFQDIFGPSAEEIQAQQLQDLQNKIQIESVKTKTSSAELEKSKISTPETARIENAS